MKRARALSLGLIAVLAVGAIGIGVFASQPNSPFYDAGESAKAAAANVAIGASGLKKQVSQALYDNREDIAVASGLSLEEVDAAIGNLSIDSWQAAPLPNDAVSTDSYQGSYAGISGTITTYDDPRYVTVEAAGQTVTLQVPETAQEYLVYLSYLD